MQKIKDIILVALLIYAFFTGWFMYIHHDGQDTTNETFATSDVDHQRQIFKLQECINEDIRPCDISR